MVGLDYGADDYLAAVRPGQLQAGCAPCCAVPPPPRERPRPGPDGLRIDVDARRVYAGDEEVPLTGKEFEGLNIPPRTGTRSSRAVG